MVDVEKNKAYKCSGCGSIYPEEHGALNCCPNYYQFDAYYCGHCYEVYEDKNEAEECCKELLSGEDDD